MCKFSTDPKISSLLNGYDYGPIETPLRVVHQGVVIYPRGTNWKETGIVLDPWPTQFPKIYSVDQFTGWYSFCRPSYISQGKNSPHPTHHHAYMYKRLLPPAPDIPRQKQIDIESPVDALITNKEGQRIGKLPDGSLVFEIDLAGLMLEPKDDGTESWYFSLPAGDYTLSLRGTGSGEVHIMTRAAADFVNVYEFEIASGEEATLELFDSNPKAPMKLSTGEEIRPSEIILDNQKPTISNLQPPDGATVTTSTPIISADYADNPGGSEIDVTTVRIIVDDVDRTTDAAITASSIAYTPDSLAGGQHNVTVEVSDIDGNYASIEWSFSVSAVGEEIRPSEIILDAEKPTISSLQPPDGATVTTSTPVISADYADNSGGSGIDVTTVRIIVDDVDRTTDAAITASSIAYTPDSLAGGQHNIVVEVSDNDGHYASIEWSFSVSGEIAPPFPAHLLLFGVAGVAGLAIFALLIALLATRSRPAPAAPLAYRQPPPVRPSTRPPGRPEEPLRPRGRPEELVRRRPPGPPEEFVGRRPPGRPEELTGRRPPGPPETLD